MGAPRSPAQASPRAASRSINFYIGAGLIAPVTCLLVLWGLLTALVLDGRLDRLRWLHTASPGHRTVIEVALLAGAGLVVVLVVVIRLGFLTRRVSAEISRVTATASGLTERQLPRIVAALHDGEPVAADDAGVTWPEMKITETAAAAAAIADLYRAAIAAAAAEAALRNGFRQILVSLGRRNQSLLHRQLRIIDGLEQQASNPAALAELFSLDHLTTRMRRHAESLTILSGAASGRSWSGPVPVIDVMRAAVAEVEDYTRVSVVTDSEEAVAAPAVTDMIHLLAELIENATLFSPSTTRVEVRAGRVANGFAVEVEDRGLGIPPEQLVQINAQLANPPDFDLADADRLGLFVTGRLAARHGVLVSLAPSPYRGTKAVVVLPDSIVVTPAEPGAGPRAALGPGIGAPELIMGRHAPARLNLRGAEVLSLASAVVPEPLLADGGHGYAWDAGDARDNGDNGDRREGAPLTTANGLPRRVRPAVAAEPWDGPARPAGSGGPGPRHALPESPAPDEARTLASALQSSWQRSRQTDQPSDPGSAEPQWPAWRQDTMAPDSTRDTEED